MPYYTISQTNLQAWKERGEGAGYPTAAAAADTHDDATAAAATSVAEHMEEYTLYST